MDLFVTLDGNGDGDGNGNGYGDGNGYGNGNGYGDGYGDGVHCNGSTEQTQQTSSGDT